MRGLKLRSLKCLALRQMANSWPTHEWMDVSWWHKHKLVAWHGLGCVSIWFELRGGLVAYALVGGLGCEACGVAWLVAVWQWCKPGGVSA